MHSVDGFDEISLTGDVKIFDNSGERVLSPSHFGMPQQTYDDIRGGDTVEESARLFINVLEGKATPQQKNAVIANAAIGLYAANQKAGLTAAVSQAREALESGKALATFKTLLESQN